MRTSQSGTYGLWTHPSYEVKVRADTFLWGSAGITTDIVFDKQLVLHVRNDLFGEDISIAIRKAGIEATLGTLKPGECVSIPLGSLSGVFASCEKESTVCCLIK